MSTKCIAIHLPTDLLDRINEQKTLTGKNQSAQIIELIEKGLKDTKKINEKEKFYFFVKVRIDTAKMMEMGDRLQRGELNASLLLSTYCVQDDPTVGLNIWCADNQKEFEDVFALHRVYYQEVLEVIPVIKPMDAMKIILDNMKNQ